MKDIWTASRLKAFQTCPQKEAYRYREMLTPAGTRPALAIGTAIHRGLETWDVEEALKSLGLNYPRDQDEADAQETASMTVKALLEGYMKKYAPFEKHRPEWQFELPVRTPTGRNSPARRIAGKIDDIVEIDGRNWIVEYKTASKLDGSYFDRLYVDSQITMYMYAAERMGFKPAGVIYRVIRKPGLRRGVREALEQYLGRLEADISARPDFYFEERQLYRSTDDLEDFERQIYWETRLAGELYRKGQCWKHSTACSMYGRCEYLPLCMGEAGAEALYETREPHEELNFE